MATKAKKEKDKEATRADIQAERKVLAAKNNERDEKGKEKARAKEAAKANSKTASAGDAMAASVGQLVETLAEQVKASSAAVVAAAATAAREAASGEVMAAAYQQQANLSLLDRAEAWCDKWTAGEKGKRGKPLPIYCNALGLNIDDLRREEE